MRLSKRLRSLEKQVGAAVCPACRERRGLLVLVDAGRSPDGSVGPAEAGPAPCPRCGEVPEQVIEIEEVVVTAADVRGGGIPQAG